LGRAVLERMFGIGLPNILSSTALPLIYLSGENMKPKAMSWCQLVALFAGATVVYVAIVITTINLIMGVF